MVASDLLQCLARMYDTHCHLTSKQLSGDVERVLADAKSSGVSRMISVATTSADAERSLALAETHDAVWCTAGVHPLYADDSEEEARDWDALCRVGEHPKCVAWGELGLDNYYDKPLRKTQDELLEEQLAFLESCKNNGLEKPIVVHCREAFDDLLAVFKNAPFDPDKYVFHCFTAGPAEAKRVLDFGAWISFTGVVTYPNAPEVAEAAKLVPADRIMVETDAPYLSPQPVRKIRPNEPKYVVHTARHIAELRGVPYTEFSQTLDANADRFFGFDS